MIASAVVRGMCHDCPGMLGASSKSVADRRLPSQLRTANAAEVLGYLRMPSNSGILGIRT